MELKSIFMLTSFKFLGRTARRPAARTCLPFCGLIMKIMTLKGIHLPKDGTVLSRLVQFPCIHSKATRFIPLLKGQRRAPSNLLKVDRPLMPLPLGKSQLLLVSPNFPKHLFFTI